MGRRKTISGLESHVFLVFVAAFSQVCSFLRKAVERVFYRDICVSKHKTYNPSGGMDLLCRTLIDRPELGQFIQCVNLNQLLPEMNNEKETSEEGLTLFRLLFSSVLDFKGSLSPHFLLDAFHPTSSRWQ